MLSRFTEWLYKQITPEQRPVFYVKIDEWSERNALLNAVLHKNSNHFQKNKDNSDKQKTKTPEPESISIHINNAGIVLLSPYFPRLYTMLGLTEGADFKDEDAKVKAIYALQYAAFENTESPEHELILNKILVGLDTEAPIPSKIDLTDEEKETITSMLNGAKQNWPKLKNTSIEGLREAFLQREGKLAETEDHYLLTVEEKAYDILLDSLPWNFRMIKHLWMGKMIQVKWR